MTLQTAEVRPRHHLLDRPIWSALTSRHGDLAVVSGVARAYPGDVAQFVATDPESRDPCANLARLVRRRRNGLTLMQTDAVEMPKGLRHSRKAAGVQMILQDAGSIGPFAGAEPLSAADVEQMLWLVQRTDPGPFFQNTIALGRYWGVRQNGHLIAMAGERLKLPGFTEISAVCVDPAFRGRGLARGLVAHVAAGILASGAQPFLHTYADNAAAISLYCSMRFALRSAMHIETLVAE